MTTHPTRRRITPPLRETLTALAAGNPERVWLTVSDLRAATGRSGPTIAGIVARLETDHRVETRWSGGDRRRPVRQYRLTDAGARYAQKVTGNA